MQKLIKLKIEGMHCESCETLIKEELVEVKGVSDININATTGEGSVAIDTDITNVNDLIIAIGKAGYKALPEEVQEIKKSTNIENGQVKITLEQKIEIEGSENDIKALNLSGVFNNQINKPSDLQPMKLTPTTEPAPLNNKGVNRISLDIEGMHCSSCAAIIEKSIKKVDGVKEANVNFAAEKASILLDESVSDKNLLLKAVEKAGYEARLTKQKSIRK
jgi:P-type Cu+ transporter